MTRSEIIEHLVGWDDVWLFERSGEVRRRELGVVGVFLRGLIEISNRCVCDCLYCGIRRSCGDVERYELSEDEVLQAAQYAYDSGWGSVVIQGGELHSERFVEKIARLCQQIKELSGGELAITLSLGEQTEEVYREWRNSGADRYLLRIESTNPQIFSSIHPPETTLQGRKKSLKTLRKLGYQLGSGIMIGLPGQTLGDIADDLLWLKNHSGIVMCGMGPFIPDPSTPLTSSPHPPKERVLLTLRATAILRLLMPRINIAASTALGTLDHTAQPTAMKIGANVLMPNITPLKYAQKYTLYQNKIRNHNLTNYNIILNTQGTSLEFLSTTHNPPSR